MLAILFRRSAMLLVSRLTAIKPTSKRSGRNSAIWSRRIAE